MITLTIDGFDKMLDILDHKRCLKEVDRAVNRAAEVLRDQTKRMPAVSGPRDGYGAKGIPLDTGRLRQSIQKRKIGLMAAEVFAPVNYSEFVHGGTKNVPSRPFFKWVLEDFQGLDMVEIVISAALERVVKP